MATDNQSPQRIADMTFLADLQPFLSYTVVKTPNADVTIGDLTFVSAQSVSSTAYLLPLANNTLPANIDLDFFQAAIGDAGQGLAQGSTMTRGQGNWLDSNGKLGANEVFIGVRYGFEVFKLRQTAAPGASATGAVPEGAAILTIPSLAALQQITQSISWTLNIGDTITRNNGPLADFPQGFGVYAAPSASRNAAGAQNGAPFAPMYEAALPLLFYPTIRTAIKAVSGTQMDLVSDATAPNLTLQKVSVETTAPFSEVLAIRMTIEGYKATSPV